MVEHQFYFRTCDLDWGTGFGFVGYWYYVTKFSFWGFVEEEVSNMWPVGPQTDEL